MLTIQKYRLAHERDQMIEMPRGAGVLTLQAQDDWPVIWAQVDSDAPPIRRRFMVFGTGDRLNDGTNWHYVGTVQVKAMVYHIYTDRVEYPKI